MYITALMDNNVPTASLMMVSIIFYLFNYKLHIFINYSIYFIPYQYQCHLSAQSSAITKFKNALRHCTLGMRDADLIGHDWDQRWHTFMLSVPPTFPRHQAAAEPHLHVCSRHANVEAAFSNNSESLVPLLVKPSVAMATLLTGYSPWTNSQTEQTSC